MPSINTNAAAFPENNRTWTILNDATKGGYAVGAFNWSIDSTLLREAPADARK